ncbi:MAG: septum formation initiator family protein [Candidatus Cloacimonadota bacterium]|nr:septum formation initiator family protein [Candidatus Cloacimonadota bacterium]
MKLFVIILVLILLWIVFFGKFNVIKILKSNQIIKDKKIEFEQLRKQKGKLAQERQQLEKADLKVIEKKARELGMAKEGEKIIRIKTDKINKTN